MGIMLLVIVLILRGEFENLINQIRYYLSKCEFELANRKLGMIENQQRKLSNCTSEIIRVVQK